MNEYRVSTTEAEKSRRDDLDAIARMTSLGQLEANRRRAEMTNDTEMLTAIDKRVRQISGHRLPFDAKGDADELRAIMRDYKTDRTVDQLRLRLRAGDISEQEFSRQWQEHSQRWTSKLDAIAKRAEERIEKAHAKQRQALESVSRPTGDATEQLLAETRAARALDRIQADIAHAKSQAHGRAVNVIEILTTALDNVDPAVARVIYEEAPTFLRDVPNAQKLVSDVIAAKNPVVSAANIDVNRAEKYRAVTQLNLNHARSRLSKPPMPENREPVDVFENSLIFATPEI